MATSFPGSLDSLSNPSAGDSLSSPSHSAQHANANDAIEALQAKVGVDGSAVTSSLDYKVAHQGLVLVKTQTVGTAVSSVTVSDAFSSTFDNYIVTKTGGTASVNSGMNLYLSGSTSSYKWVLNYSSYATSGSWIAGNTTSEWQYVGSSGTTQNALVIPINGPYLAAPTSIGPVAYSDTGATGTMTGWHGVNASYSGFVILPSSGTLTGGTIRVYGYNNG